MNEVQRPVRRRRRRRRKNYRPLLLLAAAAILVVTVVGLIVWGIGMLIGKTEPEQTDPVHTQQSPNTAPNTEHSEPTDPEVTEPVVLTAEEKIAAFAARNGLTMVDYPEKLIDLLRRNPETEEFVLNYPLEYGKEHEIDISDYADYEGVPLFIQWDEQWGYRDYFGNVAGINACGPTTLSMVAYYFTRDSSLTPAYMMEFAEANGYGHSGQGTYWALFGQGGPKLGMTVKELTAEEIASEQRIAAHLNKGELVVINVGPGVFTEVGHYMVITGYEDGKFRINDPNSRANSEKLWEFEEFADQIYMMWAFSK